ncbi:TPA: hypothetical protein ACKRWH_001060 [Providencia rettgeri]|uniref:hypothetical protein n=1 Tax=Providencia rettgeri TaxID=587 RepID=UPI000E3DF2BE|nr:hypothetical protein [Providencia rettgeri]MBI6192205.1 hypothetical protein [Providencia rettgeri]RFT10757.1 hypothetical protein DYB39_07160 [Providencia rettgeri]
MISSQKRRYIEFTTHFKGRPFSRDDLFNEFNMKKHSGATTIIKSLINYGLVYQGKDGLYHVSDDCEKMLRDGKFRSHDTSASSNGIVAETTLSALVRQFDALLAGVRA